MAPCLSRWFSVLLQSLAPKIILPTKAGVVYGVHIRNFSCLCDKCRVWEVIRYAILFFTLSSALLTPEQPFLFLLIEDFNLLWIAAQADKISGNTPSPSGGR